MLRTPHSHYLLWGCTADRASPPLLLLGLPLPWHGAEFHLVPSAPSCSPLGTIQAWSIWMRPPAGGHWGTCSECAPSLPPAMGEGVPHNCSSEEATTLQLVLATKHSTTTNHGAQHHHPCGSLPIWLSSQPDDGVLFWMPPWSHQPFWEGRAVESGSRSGPRVSCRLSCLKLTLSRTSLWFKTQCSRWEWLHDSLQMCTPNPN